jgi:hypothetical protein
MNWKYAIIPLIMLLLISGSTLAREPHREILKKNDLKSDKLPALNSSTGWSVKYTRPLKVHPSNPRYFTDGSGKAVLLSGFEFWDVLRLDGKESPLALSWEEFLRVSGFHGTNFIRLWVWNELTRFRSKKTDPWYTSKEIWKRTGPGTALDGKPKFDLTKHNQAYFDELRARVKEAGEKGFYVSIMLFEGWSLRNMEAPWRWDGHPFNVNNNVQMINGDPNGDGEGIEVHTLEIPEVTYHQEQYVKKVIDTVGDLDNALYEISNEDHAGSTEWQYHMINYIKKYESRHREKQRPVWMSALISPSVPSEDFNGNLFNSPADCISPGGTRRSVYIENPPVANGQKIIISDSDHYGGRLLNHAWVWKSFTRGLNVVNYMELPELVDSVPMHIMARNAMGHVLQYSQRMGLAETSPKGDLSSTGYALVNPGKVYLVYLPSSGHWGMRYFDKFALHGWMNWFTRRMGWIETAIVDLSASTERFRVEWFNPRMGKITDGGTTNGGGKQLFTSPFTGDSVLYIYKNNATQE